MKKCFACLEEKPIDEFYAHPKMADGHLGKCKQCCRLHNKENYLINRPYYIAYEKLRSQSPQRKEARRKGRIKFREQNPLADKAHHSVANAIRSGKLQRQPCWCGVSRAEAHHPNYNKPLDVVWLCHRHHKHIHGRSAF